MVQIANPSQWVTEIYIPLKAKTVAAPKPQTVAAPIATPLAEQPAENSKQYCGCDCIKGVGSQTRAFETQHFA